MRHEHPGTFTTGTVTVNVWNKSICHTLAVNATRNLRGTIMVHYTAGGGASTPGLVYFEAPLFGAQPPFDAPTVTNGPFVGLSALAKKYHMAACHGLRKLFGQSSDD